MELENEDRARLIAKTTAYVFMFFVLVIIAIECFFVSQTQMSLEAEGARKWASIGQGIVIVMIPTILFGASGLFPEYKKSFNVIGFAAVIISIVMMSLSQGSSDITAAKVAERNEKVRNLIEEKIKRDTKKSDQIMINVENLNKSKEAWHHVLANKAMKPSSAPSQEMDDIKDLMKIKESTPLAELVGKDWVMVIRLAIAILMAVVHAKLMNAAGDLIRKSFDIKPIGQQILDVLHSMRTPGHGHPPTTAPASPAQQPAAAPAAPAAEQPPAGGLITVQLTKFEPATASNEASAPTPQAPVTVPEATPGATPAPEKKVIQMPGWFKTILKTTGAATPTITGAAQMPLPAPPPAPDIAPPAIRALDAQDRTAATLKSVVPDTPDSPLKSVGSGEPEKPAQTPPAQPETQAQSAPKTTPKSVGLSELEKPAQAPPAHPQAEAESTPADAPKSVGQDEPDAPVKSAKKARADAPPEQVDTGVEYPFNFRFLRVEKLVKKGLLPSIDNIRFADISCGQEVARRYQAAMVKRGVITRKGSVYVLTDKYQKALDARAAKKKPAAK
jgi:hypothetical protein